MKKVELLKVAYVTFGENYNKGVFREPFEKKVLEGILANPI